MKVLWFSVTPSLFDEEKKGGWVTSLEEIFRKYHPDVELGIVFEYGICANKKVSANVTYYPVHVLDGFLKKTRSRFDRDYSWRLMKPVFLKYIDEFQPDVIQCFGSEWPYGLLVQEVNIPFVIHMQGFLNIYSMSGEMSLSRYDRLYCGDYFFKRILRYIKAPGDARFANNRERIVMQKNSYFLGRTNWDKDIVHYFSNNGKYFYCAEAIRPIIYNSKSQWIYKPQQIMKLVTITSGSVLKGNEIILRTANLLKNQFHFEFIWEVAGDANSFRQFEKKTGINHSKVNIKLLGVIDAQTIINKLVSAQVYIHPAIIDNSPNSLCEAQIIGCPVIAARTGGIDSMVEDGKTGVLYPYNEPFQLAFEIMKIHNNEEKLRMISENERTVALERHNPEKIGKCLINIYQKVIEDYYAKN